MSEYQPGAIEYKPAPENLNPRPNPNDACRPSSSRPRDPEDPDDPEAQRRTKRPFIFDLNEMPEDQGGAGGTNQGYNCQQVDWTNFPRWPGVEIDRPFSGINTSDTSPLWNIRGDSLGIPLGLTREENVSTKPQVQRNMICYETLMSSTTVDIHDELRR
jgi:hypothetical protein